MSESTGGTARVQPIRESASGTDRWSSLVQAMAAGDAQALSDFYDEASRYVQTITLRILRDPDEAEEVTLDVFQQVWKLAGNYDPARCSVSSWIGMMARSRALDRWRSLQSRRRMLADEIPEGVEPVAPGVGAETELSSAQQRERVRSALSALPDEQRRMIELSFWEGLSHSEVSEKTGVPLGTVKTRIRLGMLKLKESLGEVRHV